MFFRIALALVATFFVFQVIYASPNRVTRDTTSTGTDTGKSIDDAINAFTQNLESIMKNIQSNEVFQNISSSLKSFGEEVQQQGQHLVEKIQKSTTDVKTK